MPHIHNSVKGIIIKNDAILLTKNKDKQGIFYLLPGGGQEAFETMSEALKRECLEEIAAKVEVKNLCYIREYIGRNHEFSKDDFNFHQIEYMFACDLLEPITLENGHIPDEMQVGVEWIRLENLKNIRLYPKILTEKLLERNNGSSVYLGDVN